MKRSLILNLNRLFVGRQRRFRIPNFFFLQFTFRNQQTVTRGPVHRSAGRDCVAVEHDLGTDVAQVKVAPETGETVTWSAANRNSASRTFSSGADEGGRRRGFVTSVRPDPESSVAMSTS